MPGQITRDYARTRPTKVWNRLTSYALFEGRPITTRGRWINPLLFAHFALHKRLPQPKKVDRPIYVLGTGRSGTTVLGVVLSMHRDVGFLNEPKALWCSVYPPEDVIGNYTDCPPRFSLGAEQASASVKAAAHKLYGAYLRFAGARRVLDKSDWMFRVSFLRSIFPDAQFLFLVRDGWDTIRSIDRWSQRLGQEQGGETHDWWGVNDRKWLALCDQLLPTHPDFADHAAKLRATDDHTTRAAVEWVVTMQEGLRLRAELPEGLLTVHLEQLAEQPRAELERIAGFCGLRPDPKSLEFGERTLAPAPTGPALELPPYVLEPFERTQRELGYRL